MKTRIILFFWVIFFIFSCSKNKLKTGQNLLVSTAVGNYLSNDKLHSLKVEYNKETKEYSFKVYLFTSENKVYQEGMENNLFVEIKSNSDISGSLDSEGTIVYALANIDKVDNYYLFKYKSLGYKYDLKESEGIKYYKTEIEGDFTEEEIAEGKNISYKTEIELKFFKVD